MHAQPSLSDPAAPGRSGAPSAPSLLTVPLPLTVDLNDTPLAIGLYCLVARQFIIRKAAIPLSAPDVQRYDPQLSRGAVLRALARLVQGGWLIEQTQAGRKTSYTPAWGRVHGAARAWQIGEPILGRPRRMIVVRVDQRLLDTCIGKLTPHPLRTALIERYLTHPALSLADIGAYALAQAGYSAATPALLRMALIQSGRPQPAPADEQLLARASQYGLEPAEPTALTERGLRRLGCAPQTAATTPQPLFFVEKTMIGSMIDSMIDSMIGHQAPPQPLASAAARPKPAPTAAADRSHGLNLPHEPQAESPLNPPRHAGGGLSMQQDAQQPAAAAETPAAQALRAINVLPAQIAELAELSLALVQAAIADGRARSGVRDLAGWVVSLLRSHRDHGLPIRSPAAYADAPEALGAYFAQLAAQNTAVAEASAPSQCSAELTAPHYGVVGAARPDLSGSGEDLAHSLADHGRPSVVALEDLVQAQLRLVLPRREFLSWGQQVRLVRVAGALVVLQVPSLAAKAMLEARALGRLRAELSDALGAAVLVRVHLAERAAAPPLAARLRQ